MDSTTLNELLMNFSDKLKPSDDFLEVQDETANRIFGRLYKKKIKLDRMIISGSIGKDTAICVDPDFDLVIFVDHQRPPFEKILSNFQYYMKPTSLLDIKHIKVTKFSMQFNVNGISVNLFPATNFVTEDHNRCSSKLVHLQTKRAVKCIRGRPEFGYRYGSAFCEQRLEFFKNQTPFIHQVVRLAKFWDKTLNIGTYISGRSTMIELIGIEAGKSEEAKGEGHRSCLEAFRLFLNLMSEFNTLCIRNCYKVEQISPDVNSQRPLVIDPANPYNNFAYFPKQDKMEIIQKFKEFANETLKRLNNFKDMNQLFEVQPKKFVLGIQPQEWFIDTCTCDKKLVNPKLRVNLPDESFQSKDWNVMDVQQCLLTTLAAANLGSDGTLALALEVAQLKKMAQNCVDVNILGMPSPRDWNDNDNSSDGHDVTLSIPVPGNPNLSVVLCASW